MKLPKAKHQYGEKVKIKWHEAECGITDCVIIAIRGDRRFPDAPPDYEVMEVNIETGEYEPGSVDEVGEDMIL